ncbi:MAG: hypothetical protein HQK55_09040, partial [Deltaproteobacteria bacterium]|nr:hypothetical protein [Deltaproteobacteria bacterium]
MITFSHSPLKSTSRLFSNPQAWIWGAIVLSFFICGSISWIHFRQRQVLGQTVSALENIRQARIDLAKGFLHTSLAGEPGSPFNRDQGLALLQQAIISLENAMRWDGEETRDIDLGLERSEFISTFSKSVSNFRDHLAESNEKGLRQPGLETALRIAFYDLERQADRVDTQIHSDLQKIITHLDLIFILSLGGSVLL